MASRGPKSRRLDRHSFSENSPDLSQRGETSIDVDIREKKRRRHESQNVQHYVGNLSSDIADSIRTTSQREPRRRRRNHDHDYSRSYKFQESDQTTSRSNQESPLKPSGSSCQETFIKSERRVDSKLNHDISHTSKQRLSVDTRHSDVCSKKDQYDESSFVCLPSASASHNKCNTSLFPNDLVSSQEAIDTLKGEDIRQRLSQSDIVNKPLLNDVSIIKKDSEKLIYSNHSNIVSDKELSNSTIQHNTTIEQQKKKHLFNKYSSQCHPSISVVEDDKLNQQLQDDHLVHSKDDGIEHPVCKESVLCNPNRQIDQKKNIHMTKILDDPLSLSSKHHYNLPSIDPPLKKNSLSLMKTNSNTISTFGPMRPIPFNPIEGPPMPNHPPTTFAQLRVLLLVGFLSSQTLPSNSQLNKQHTHYNMAGMHTHTRGQTIVAPRFCLTCPIHSSMIAKLIRDFFMIHYHIPRFALLPFQSHIIATELRLLNLGICDYMAGPIEHLFSITLLSNDSVIVDNFDFIRCDRLLRICLRPEHPSLARTLWDPTPRQCVQVMKELGLGAGLGVENRYGKLYTQTDLNQVYDDGLPCLTTHNQIIHDDIPMESHPLLGIKENDLTATQLNDYNLTNSSHLLHPPHFQESYHDPSSTLTHEPVIESSDSIILNHQRKSTTPLESFQHKFMNGTTLSRLGQSTSFFPSHPLSQQRHPSQHVLHLENQQGGPILSTTTPVDTKELHDPLSLEDLLNAPSAKEQQLLESGAELRQLLTVPSAKHSITTRAFQNRGGSRVQQICRHGTRHDCLEAAISLYNQQTSKLTLTEMNMIPRPQVCPMIHFRRILLPHTDVSLGDCSYLDTCRHMASCRFVHYEVDLDVGTEKQKSELIERMGATDQSGPIGHNIGTVFSGQLEELPAQWITCDVRKFDWSIFRGKVKVLMADPPWDIHMDLPYGTMTDSEMKSLRLDQVQDEGCLFLWVTGRAMELGRECMKLWGYRQIEEIVWVKTNQLHRIIRTGRTGHWLNHSKEHCLVGIKGNPKLNRNLDTDIIVAEVRETSRKPDEIYRIIERLCPGPYKLELFGRPHNVRDNWVTLGNQLDHIHLHDTQLIQRYNNFATAAGISLYQPSIMKDIGIDTNEDNQTQKYHNIEGV